MEYHSILSITKIGQNNYRYALRQPNPQERFSLPTEQQDLDVAVDPKIITVLCAKIHRNVYAAIKNPREALQYQKEIVNFGQVLYDLLLPKGQDKIDELRKTLRSLSTPLLISTDAPEIYWELLYDNEAKAFWGTQYRMGRRLRVRNVPGTKPRDNEVLKCLIIANPNAGHKRLQLPAAAREAAKLRDWLVHHQINCDDFLIGKQASLDSVIEHLAKNEYDLIHFSGHSVEDQDSKGFALLLHDEELLPARTIARMVRGNPLVFLNSCLSGAAKGAASTADSMADLTDAFLEAGAQIVVGSLFDIPDEGARVFAEKFYETVLINHKPVGEAMRNARKHVEGKAEYAAAWASFVMYGDPCLCLEIAEDKIQTMLERLGLHRENFDVSCLRVIERAHAYAQTDGQLSTAHLFAALIDGDDDFLRNWLRQKGNISPEELRDAFRGEITVQAKTEEIALSDNVQQTLKNAWKKAQKDQRKITERDVLQAFARKTGGTTGALLKKIGIDITEIPRIIDGDPEGNGESGIREIGPLASSDCEDGTWRMLLYGAYFARRDKQDSMSTIHLVRGMMQNENSAFAAACKAYELAAKHFGNPLTPEEEKKAEAVSGKIGCSESVETILRLAKEAAEKNRAKVNDRDLLAAFLRQGGGQTGHVLRKQGTILDFMLSAAFQKDGGLNFAAFDQHLQQILQESIKCAEKKRNLVVGRRHLIYAWLAQPGGLLAKEIKKQRKAPQQLAEALFVKIPGGQKAVKMEAHVRFLAPSVMQLILAAEEEMKAADQTCISEDMLLRPAIAAIGDETGQLLAEKGVLLSKILR